MLEMDTDISRRVRENLIRQGITAERSSLLTAVTIYMEEEDMIQK